MRTIPILIIAAIATASTATAYYFLRDNDLAKRAEEAKPSIGSTATLDVQDTLIRDGRHDQPANLEQPRLTLLQEKVAALEVRLRNMETTASEQSQRQAISGQQQRNSKREKVLRSRTSFAHGMDEALDTGDVDHDAAKSGTEQAKAKKFSEADFAHWMDEALDAGDVNHNAIKSVMDQAETSFAKVSGINLNDIDMQCSEYFCRATLIPATGKQLNIPQLIGASPFMDSGTIIHNPDGSVRIYFTQPGQSLSELRSEAQKGFQ